MAPKGRNHLGPSRLQLRREKESPRCPPRLVRERLIGLPDQVARWPEPARTWPRRWTSIEIEGLAGRIDREAGLTRQAVALAREWVGYRGGALRFRNGGTLPAPRVAGSTIDLGIALAVPRTRSEYQDVVGERMVAGAVTWLLGQGVPVPRERFAFGNNRPGRR